MLKKIYKAVSLITLISGLVFFTIYSLIGISPTNIVYVHDGSKIIIYANNLYWNYLDNPEFLGSIKASIILFLYIVLFVLSIIKNKRSIRNKITFQLVSSIINVCISIGIGAASIVLLNKMSYKDYFESVIGEYGYELTKNGQLIIPFILIFTIISFCNALINLIGPFLLFIKDNPSIINSKIVSNEVNSTAITVIEEKKEEKQLAKNNKRNNNNNNVKIADFSKKDSLTDLEEKLIKLKKLYEKGLITLDDYNTLKNKYLNNN